jgi:hypothetical protein
MSSCSYLALLLLQNDSAAGPTGVREDHIAACIGWEAWKRSQGIKIEHLLLIAKCFC